MAFDPGVNPAGVAGIAEVGDSWSSGIVPQSAKTRPTPSQPDAAAQLARGGQPCRCEIRINILDCEPARLVAGAYLLGGRKRVYRQLS